MVRINLPEYPCKTDMWDMLKNEERAIVCYGMGNGADKLIVRLKDYEIEIADFFASDGFVRGHSFHGKRVLSFSEIKEKYSAFVILLSFASNREEVLGMLDKIDEEYDMLIPDMPVAGTEYFDKNFYNEHYSEICDAYNSLSDEKSKDIFASIINYKLYGKMEYLRNSYCSRDELYDLLPREKIKSIVDAGAYNGDTIREAKLYFPGLLEAVAIEPDSRNYKKLIRYIEAEKEISVKAYNKAAWFKNADGLFFCSGNRNSTVNATASYENKHDAVALASIDSLVCDKIDYIKYDVEGAEFEALEGSRSTITKNHPSLLVSAYHRSRDIFFLVNYIKEKYPFYRLFMSRLRCVPAWELDIIAVAEE